MMHIPDTPLANATARDPGPSYDGSQVMQLAGDGEPRSSEARAAALGQDTDADTAPRSDYSGPAMQLVEQIDWHDLERAGGFGARDRPLLVKGAVKAWRAWERWTFDKLAELRRADGSEVLTSFQNGLVEQGATKQPLIKPVAPYLRQLAAEARQLPSDDVGLLSARRHRALAAQGKSSAFYLDWSYLKRFEANRAYLAQWYILDEFPELRRDFAIKTLWPGSRYTWEYTFIGPAHTLTGLHYDFPNNWFCQVTGIKEFLLFPADQAPHMWVSKKYDWGATLSDIDITKLDEQPERATSFARAKGLYARVEAGDALFIPRRTWHAVLSHTPAISLAVFGLNAWEIVAGGGPAQVRDFLHRMRLYRHRNCTCHETPRAV